MSIQPPNIWKTGGEPLGYMLRFWCTCDISPQVPLHETLKNEVLEFTIDLVPSGISCMHVLLRLEYIGRSISSWMLPHASTVQYIYKYDNICKASQTTATAKQLDLDHEIGYSLQIFSLRHPQWEAANHQTDAYESEAADTQNEPSVGDNWYHLSRRQWHSVQVGAYRWLALKGANFSLG